MNQRAPGRLRRTLFAVLATLAVFVGIAGAVLLVAYWSDSSGLEPLRPLLGNPDDALIWQIMVGMLGSQVALVFLAYLFSFDTRASRRPRIGMIISLVSTGMLVASVTPPNVLPDFRILSLPGFGLLLTCAILIPFLWFGCEYAVASFLAGLLKRADAQKQQRKALLLSRLLLLFRPGQRETLRSVALERFRRGDHSEILSHELQSFFEEGDHSEEVVEALCRLSAEHRDAERYLFYLNRLHLLRPEDTDLTEALIEENLAQENQNEALRLIEEKGVGKDLSERSRYANLLLTIGNVERAMEIARGISKEEGIPYTTSSSLAKRSLEKRPQMIAAINLLGEQALAARNLDRAVRRFEESLEIDPNQSRIQRFLLDLYRETHLTDSLERLLANWIERPENAGDIALLSEYVDILVVNNKTQEAREFLAVQTKKHPEAPDLLDRYADVLCGMEAWKEAADVNEMALEKAANDEQTMRSRSRAARIERALLSAEVYDLQQEVEANPQDEDLAIQLIVRLSENGQMERAIAQADHLLHRCSKARDRVKETMRDLGLRPDGPFILLSYLADLYLENRQFDSVLDLIEPLRIRSMTPDAVEADLCQKIVDLVPNHLQALRRLGDINRREHRFSEMVHHYVLFVAHGGESTEEINKALFEAYEHLNDYANAKAYGLGLMKNDPKDDTYPFRLAQLAFKADHLEESLEFAKQSKAINPKNTEADRLIKKVDRILREQLSEELQARVDQGKPTAVELETLADLYYSLDKIDKAIPLFQRAARGADRPTRSKAKLALCLAEKGLFDLANETVQEIKILPDSEETKEILDLLYEIGAHFEAERITDKAGKIYKAIFLVDAGYRDVVKKVERYT